MEADARCKLCRHDEDGLEAKLTKLSSKGQGTYISAAFQADAACCCIIVDGIGVTQPAQLVERLHVSRNLEGKP